MFNPTAYANSRGGGVAVLEVLEKPRTRRGIAFVPLRRTEIGGELLGPLAALTVTHAYRYSREQCDRVLEAAYRFPLPGDAAVTGVVVTFGEVEVRAELREREGAEEEYARAISRGDQAALLSRESPDVFTLRVAGLRPDEDVIVETSYVQLARPEGAGWSLRLPLTAGLRYSRSDERGSPHADGQPGLYARDPGHDFSLDVLAPTHLAVSSTTHALEVSDEDGRSRVRLAARRVVPDRDCILAWRPRLTEDRPALAVLAHDEPAEGQVYFLALVTPPGHPEPARTVPREVIILVDHSGSMSGAKWQAADWAVKRFLADLTADDSFALGLFHDKTRWFSRGLQRAEPAAVAAATRFLAEHRDTGGTELGVALEQALRLPKGPGERSRHVIVVTDAQVSDFGRILRLVEAEARRPERRRVSVLCIDAAPNSTLVLELAERGGGVARFLTSDPGENDIATALDEVLLDWSQPVASALRLEVDRPAVEASGRQVLAGDMSGWCAVDVGDLPAGRPVWVAGRAARGNGEPLRLRLCRRGEPVCEATVPLAEGRNGEPALEALFGARRVVGLEYLLHSGREGGEFGEQLARLGYDPARDLAPAGEGSAPVYAENAREEGVAALRRLLARESLRYRLLSAATAFTAVRREAGLRVEESVVVPNALPHGWSEDFLAAPMMLRSSSSDHLLRRTTDMSMAVPCLEESAEDSYEPSQRSSSLLHRFGLPQLQAAFRSPARRKAPDAAPVFAGTPDLQGGECVLFDSDQVRRGSKVGPRLGALVVRFPDGEPAPAQIDPGLVLLLYVGDMATPRARVRLLDLVRQGGERPLNLVLAAEERACLVLRDETGSWATSAPRLEVSLRG